MIFLLATSFLAGLLAILSPCVLPIAPVLLVSAWQQHRWGPLALVAGLTTTFTLVGLTLAITGTLIGLSPEAIHIFFSVLLVTLGLTLLFTGIEALWTRLIHPLATKFHGMAHRFSLTGLDGQFFLGLILGGAWLPCMGPTLGLAVNMAHQRQNLLQAALIMFMYSLGASLPLILLSYISREIFGGHKKWARFAKHGKKVLGFVALMTGLLLMTNWMQSIESWLLIHSPIWLIRLTTLY